MGTYVLRRILIAFPVLLGITIVSFVAPSLAPGDPLMARLAPEQLNEIQRNPQLLEERRRELSGQARLRQTGRPPLLHLESLLDAPPPTVEVIKPKRKPRWEEEPETNEE